MSTSTPDPLNALRDAIRSKASIIYANDAGPVSSLSAATKLVLSPSLSFPKDTPTRLRKPDATATNPQSDPNAFFRLDAVYLTWLLRDASVAEYMQQARECKLLGAFVGITDRKGVAEWLDGKTSSYKGVVPLESDSHTPPGSPPSQSITLPKTGPPGAAASTTTTGSPAKRRHAVDAADAEVVKKIKANEIELSDRTSVLRGTKPNDFSNVRLMFAERLKKLKEASKNGAIPPPAVAPKIENMLPIIMISSSPTSLITMYNVRKFLQEASFESPSDARTRAASEGTTRPEDVIPIYRTHTHIDPSGQERRTQSRYYVVDGVDALAKFGSDAWDRVVCVLTTGQAWQFKPYKWTEPMTLFHHVKGFYVSWANDPPNVKIKDWNVTELKIDQHRRHVDKSVVANFWKTLDAWTLANKPWLMKS
ncbi:RNA polymerase II-associated protein [Fomitiporia mediterranea MF3/22]|uniref:RNA polymerase II-associated protein n=1 Tax=Fomitiporia mediterranea (strain MF3/22) TaxID=694068 RepID=UPI0004408BFB|nr:RNA polymerase II-associated protein [Fomitiporia mediterranea MF3/22]EJD06202.1 RNA polymerase II-associated protein [Fomitiporia mediterranea MF3/22]